METNMEGLKQVIKELQSRPLPPTEQEILNAAREYLQTLILKFIYQSKQGAALSFMGGTCLRICYDLKRYSEDLDFSLDDKKVPFDFPLLVATLEKQISLLGFQVTSQQHAEKIVQKGFLSFAGLPGALNLKSFRKEQKIHIKVEVDTRPPVLEAGDRESYFVNRFHEIFPILKHSQPTLFTGKILAVLFRAYTRGRDYYDLLWHLGNKTAINLIYLNRGHQGTPFKNEAELFEALREKIHRADPAIVLKDIERFLEDPAETAWISRYQELFEQLVRTRKGQAGETAKTNFD